MPSDYAAISAANRTEYGNVGRWGRDVLVDRYDSSAHFIFELLQNAEDALKRRFGWSGSRSVRFELADDALRVMHFGNPFTPSDVRGVCGIGETTKDLTDIGRFGIGFKSVYSVTERPEVHSGDEHFAIEHFAFPVAVSAIGSGPDETVFVLPLRRDDSALHSAVASDLSELGPRTLLFLRQIEEITWNVEGGSNGIYLKGKPEETGVGGRRVQIIGERDGQLVADETWLIFSREVYTESKIISGYIEIAFLIEQDADQKQWTVRPIDTSPLVAFFPTVVSTQLGFLVQGPYRTTPSRDNVPPHDAWNVELTLATAELLIGSFDALKAQNMFDVEALRSLPLERSRFPEGGMFAPFFDAVRQAMSTQALLPRAGGGWACAKNARLARTEDLRDLFDPKQLGALLNSSDQIAWLTGDITRDTAA